MSDDFVGRALDAVSEGFRAVTATVTYAASGGGSARTGEVEPGKTKLVEYLENLGIKPSTKMLYTTDKGVTLSLEDVIPEGTGAVIASVATDNG